MKLSAGSSASRRDAMRQRQRLHRIGAPMLRTRFPGLLSLHLDFDFSDQSDQLPSPQTTVLHPPAPAYFCFACPYSDCDGEFDLTNEVNVVLNARDTQTSGQIRCAGTRQGGAACTLCLEYSVLPRWA